jgi:hypothetical protein
VRRESANNTVRQKIPLRCALYDEGLSVRHFGHQPIQPSEAAVEAVGDEGRRSTPGQLFDQFPLPPDEAQCRAGSKLAQREHGPEQVWQVIPHPVADDQCSAGGKGRLKLPAFANMARKRP